MHNWQTIKLTNASNHKSLERMQMINPLDKEIWYQDQEETDLWHHNSGLLINTQALRDREAYYQIIRIQEKESQFDFDQLDLFA